ncbi:zinc finger CCHC domain-containing protein 24-like [Bolinopsis microptera]|uniref:zinc finger CCHC domain-containing protein 24-like n=1 Tax=Bolinopsis microptera TaxID=2820187 RepID=UPI00307A572E
MSDSIGKTEYQGSARMFGHFQCPNCRRGWQSGNSWANTGQMCQKCNIMVFPHEQKPLERVGNKEDKCNPTVSHPQELCGKCKRLGYPCTKFGRDRY